MGRIVKTKREQVSVCWLCIKESNTSSAEVLATLLTPFPTCYLRNSFTSPLAAARTAAACCAQLSRRYDHVCSGLRG